MGQKFNLRVERLQVTLLAHGNRASDILAAVDQASTWTQSQLLEPKEKNNISILHFVTPYDQNLFQLNYLLPQRWSYINNDPMPSFFGVTRDYKWDFQIHVKFIFDVSRSKSVLTISNQKELYREPHEFFQFYYIDESAYSFLQRFLCF